MVLSVVIITKNEQENILDCVESARKISDDIIVVDSGSSDKTVEMALGCRAKILEVQWSNFGTARNAGAELAQYDWVLALDADERISEDLASSIRNLKQDAFGVIYGFKRQSFLGNKKIRFGDWGRDKVFRIYNRCFTSWNLFPVHESLILKGVKKKFIKGNLEHFVLKSVDQNREKLARYAKLCAKKYCLLGRKSGLVNLVVSPSFSFVIGYFVRFGFLDGKEGFYIARTVAYYTWLKYLYLQKFSKGGRIHQLVVS
jgi:glycosyltransferase involved in cell wall biosynthesis